RRSSDLPPAFGGTGRDVPGRPAGVIAAGVGVRRRSPLAGVLAGPLGGGGEQLGRLVGQAADLLTGTGAVAHERPRFTRSRGALVRTRAGSPYRRVRSLMWSPFRRRPTPTPHRRDRRAPVRTGSAASRRPAARRRPGTAASPRATRSPGGRSRP